MNKEHMIITYSTSQIAKIVGLHPNTVRLYEEWGLIQKPERKKNGYRVYNDVHIKQFALVRKAFQIEVLQAGLRKRMVNAVKLSAVYRWDEAIELVEEYIRNRRLALAGNDLLATDEKIIDIAMKYGYDSPDSFTKAFTRFHGITPASVRKDEVMLKSFAPLKIKISVEGGYLMDYKIVKKEAFTVIANAKEFPYEGAKEIVPKFWQEHFQTGKGAVVCGCYGINIDEEMGGEKFEYLIADPYNPQKEIPEGFVTRVIPAFDWAVFPCRGSMPEALQDVNTKIYTEWLPALKEYEFAAGYCVEYYDDPAKYEKGTLDENYYCEIWIPVKRK